MRRPLIIGNWKLNGSYCMISSFMDELCKELINDDYNCTIAIAPPEVYIDFVKRAINKNINIIIAAQNIDINLYGAFTGETSAAMLKDVGVKYIIIGHSERRIYHKESSKLIAKKFAIVKEQGLIPVLCIGETEEDNKCGRTKNVCAAQIDAILEAQGEIAFYNSVIAYEPIWAIGTGKSASPLQAQLVNEFIRNYIAKINTDMADKIILQYGGSINANNAIDLLSQPDIDGVLIGNASLRANSFIKIIKAIKHCKSL